MTSLAPSARWQNMQVLNTGSLGPGRKRGSPPHTNDSTKIVTQGAAFAIITGDRDSAKDIVQDSWIAIIKGINKLEDPALFAAWAYRIVNNKSVDLFRRQKSQRILVEQMPRSDEDLSGTQ